MRRQRRGDLETRHPRHAAALVVLAAVLGGGAAAPPAADPAAVPPAAPDSTATAAAGAAPLSAAHRQWLAEHTLLLSEAEQAAFVALAADYQRDAFVDRFWRERDPYPGTARNELRELWQDRLATAKENFGDLADIRSRFWMLNGPPQLRWVSDCAGIVASEVWFYAKSRRVRDEIHLVFYRPGGLGPFRLYQPLDGPDVLTVGGSVFQDAAGSGSGATSGCRHEGAEILGRALAGVGGRKGFEWATYALEVQRLEAPIVEASGEWLGTFAAYSTDVAAGTPTFAAGLDFAFPGRRQARTVVQGLVSVAAADLAVADLGGARSYNLLLTGEVLRDGALLDRFRYKFDLPADGAATTLPLVFERQLRPGSYRLLLKVEDSNGGRAFRGEREVVVPAVDAAYPLPAEASALEAFADANAALAGGLATVTLQPPVGEPMVAGKQRFEAVVEGEGAAELVFELDDRPVLTRNGPPWTVELDVGHLPRARLLRVIARDTAGRIVATDEMLLNASPHRFLVSIERPLPGEAVGASARVAVTVDVPPDAVLERVELFRDDAPVATLYQPPFELPVALPAPGEIAVLRAVAHTADGARAEDSVFVNAPPGLEQVEVRLVEVYAAVTDRQGGLVRDLELADFTVREDGVPQQPVRFERVRDLPIKAVLLLDVSQSMAASLAEAQRAALGFFESAVGPRDRAALITFNDRPQLVTGLTNRIVDLGGGLAGLTAERGTALYDGVVFALHYLNGVSGPRAVVVLSDGKDESSHFELEQTLELARRAGVTLYTVGLSLDGDDRAARKALERLAAETGGRAFTVAAAAELAPVYALIEEELRAQYLLVYQSTNGSAGRGFRRIEVELRRGGLEAKTARGYYP